ncbi:MAG TPA: tRNA (N(6)-L-threonylcarbamoyladenosine(37)-C(2))-methylthiotransferase MtaB [Candidatus Limnocylindrales bacterium]|nr:tRNA (N(6)-L-threonylcarbamoyladenosine(37)-C(2))-methylthiotransferase MtaB [Candidatus Limnocylindrales bacterium]
MIETPPRPVRSAAITNLGCKVNQSEMESAARLLRERGIRVVDGDVGANADLVLVNTCTVTATADQKSRQAVRRARRANPDAEVIVTGCSVQVGREAFAAADPAARLIDNRSKDALLEEVERLVGPAGSSGSLPRALPTLSGVDIEGIADGRASIERTRAFVKVQDGCSFFCTYCIIPAARGAERSLSPETVLRDVRRALRAGHREIVLTGINIGTYDGGWSERGFRGSHTRSALTLAGLVRRILDETPVERLRLSSIEPQHVDDELLRVWSEGAPRTMPHVHLPLQSGDDGVLHRMGRRYVSADYAATVGRIRGAVPGVAIHGDVIVGFPTEDEAAWRRSLDFIRSVEFAGIHVFRYSARPGTPAVRMAGQVDEPTRKRRAGELLAVAADARVRWARAHVGAESTVLFETPLDDGRWAGHATDHTLVAARPRDDTPLENVIGRVRIEAVDPGVRDRVVGHLVGAVSPPRQLPGGPDGH